MVIASATTSLRPFGSAIFTQLRCLRICELNADSLSAGGDPHDMELNFVIELRNSGFTMPDRNARAVTDVAYEWCDTWLDGTPGSNC